MQAEGFCLSKLPLLHSANTCFSFLAFEFVVVFFQDFKITFEEAILARKNLIKENQQKVSEIKKEVSNTSHRFFATYLPFYKTKEV